MRMLLGSRKICSVSFQQSARSRRHETHDLASLSADLRFPDSSKILPPPRADCACSLPAAPRLGNAVHGDRGNFPHMRLKRHRCNRNQPPQKGVIGSFPAGFFTFSRRIFVNPERGRDELFSNHAGDSFTTPQSRPLRADHFQQGPRSLFDRERSHAGTAGGGPPPRGTATR